MLCKDKILKQDNSIASTLNQNTKNYEAVRFINANIAVNGNSTIK